MVMKSLKSLLVVMLLGSSGFALAQVSASSSDMSAWKWVRFFYDRTFVNQDWERAEGLDVNGFSIDYEHAFRVAKKLPLFI